MPLFCPSLHPWPGCPEGLESSRGYRKKSNTSLLSHGASPACLCVQSCTSGWRFKAWLDGSQFGAASRFLSPFPTPLFLTLHEDSVNSSIGWFLYAVIFLHQLQWGGASSVIPFAAAVLVYSSAAVTAWFRPLQCNCCLGFATLWVGAAL